MKQVKIKTLNKEIILIELPENYKVIEALVAYRIEKDSKSDHLEFSKINYKLKGLLSELTDENVKPLIPQIDVFYRNDKTLYEHPSSNYDRVLPEVETSLEYFNYALEAEGLFFNGNPYEKFRYSKVSNPNYELFTEAESRTFDKTRTILMVEN